ncbi:MAG: class I SAM-dependent methyltransferase [Verrucomicrobiaceae bacterium]
MTLRNRLGILYRNLFASAHLAAAKSRLSELLKSRGESPEALVAITDEFKGRGWFLEICSWQVKSEFTGMVQWAMEQKPTNILEIGTAKGATLLSWCRVATHKVVSVDLPGGIHGGGYPAIKQGLYQHFVADRPGVSLCCIQDDSQAEATRQKAEDFLQGDKLDLLFIDGDHTYAGVKRDFELWSPLVRPGGHVLFHDILPHKDLPDCEVDKLWSELKQRFTWREFVENPEQGWAGIGAVQMPG